MNLEGKTVGRYKIITRLGRGAQAEVYLAEPQSPIPHLNKQPKQVALKVLNARSSGTQQLVERFFNEIQAMRQLRHRHIVSIYELAQVNIESEQVYFYTMRYVSGGTLEDWLKRNKRLPLHTVTQIIKQIASGLSEAHKYNIIHRDIKPSNIMVEYENGELRTFLTDFGVAKLIGHKTITQDGQTLIGTPNYMSPEQIKGHELDRRADVYSLGVMLFELVTGTLPYEEGGPQAVLYFQVNTPFPSVQTVDPNLPAWVDPIVAKATAKEPNERYRETYHIANELHHRITGQFVRRPRTMWIPVVLATLAIIVILATVILSWDPMAQLFQDSEAATTESIAIVAETTVEEPESDNEPGFSASLLSQDDDDPELDDDLEDVEVIVEDPTPARISALATSTVDPNPTTLIIESTDTPEPDASETPSTSNPTDSFSILSPTSSVLTQGGNTNDGSGEYLLRWEGDDLSGRSNQFFAMIITTPSEDQIIGFTGHNETSRRVNLLNILAGQPSGPGYAWEIVHYEGIDSNVGQVIRRSDRIEFTWRPN